MLGYEQLSVADGGRGLVIVSAVCLLEVELPLPRAKEEGDIKEEQETPKEQVVA